MPELVQNQQSAPSYHFLHQQQPPTTLTDNGTAFLGAYTGFLPPHSLPSLPPPYSQWYTAASNLPTTCYQGNWEAFVQAFPQISANQLPDHHLLRANACLGAVAHALQNIAFMPVPEKIMTPWNHIGQRLQRPCTSFNSLDWFIYNYEIIDDRFVSHIDHPTTSQSTTSHVVVSDPWQQTKPYLTLTGCMTETHFITGCMCIEHAARLLPGVVAKAQQAVVQRDNHQLRDALLQINTIIEDMAVAFQSADVRPLSHTFVDQVEWGRCIGVAGLPVVPGEKTISGLLFPSVHLLDVFFSRPSYQTEMGTLEKTDRKWLPQLHRKFLNAVSQVSIFDYIEKSADGQLMCIFKRALLSFAHESGFLGKHRLRIIGFLELSMKVGRPATAAGTATVNWQRRAWRAINNAMREGMRERLERFSDHVSEVTVKSCKPVAGNESSYRLVLDTKGALVYEPGDHIAILPENSDVLINETLDALQMHQDDPIPIKSETWLQALRERGLNIDSTINNGTVCVTAKTFFRIATLQPFDYELGRRLVDSMFVVNPAVKSYLCQEKATNFPIAVRILTETNDISTKHLISALETVLKPLSPRYYSISSHMSFTPSSVEICVGKVQYNSQSSVSFKYGLIPWRKTRSEGKVLPIAAAREQLSKYVMKRDHCVNDDGNMECCKKSENRLDEYQTDRIKDLAERFWPLMSGQQTGETTPSPFTMKALFRAQVLCYEALHKKEKPINLPGVSSSFLSQLQPGTTVRAQIIPQFDFHIPKDPNVPLVMISLGTGVAPFRAFMKELIKQKPKDGSPCRKAWLILGVRTKDSIPFLEDIEEAVCKEKVLRLSLAVSQEDVDVEAPYSAKQLKFRAGTRKRIPQLFEQDPSNAYKLWDMLNSGGHIYACGKPDLEPLVRQVVSFTVKKYAHTLRSRTFFDTNYDLHRLADEFADKLAADKRLHIDAYSSGAQVVSKSMYTAADVAEHRTIESCWVMFGGCVYDITRYLAVHPGGPKLLLDKGGRDMTEDFNEAHGSGNFRIASMMEPYKIGMVEPFAKMSDRIKTFMTNWSVPLLHGVMEHRSVLSLDWNEFPKLYEPKTFVQWKSQVSAPDGINCLTRKFWNTYEPQVFELIEDFVGPKQLGKLLLQHCKELGGELDCQLIQEELRERRRAGLNAFTENENNGEACEMLLHQFCNFMDDLVKMCIAVQRDVEQALQTPLSTNSFQDVLSVMIWRVIHHLTEGIEAAYADLPCATRNVNRKE